MPRRLAVLCPIDFSAASLDALRYAAAFAEGQGGQLVVMTVEDPLLAALDADAGRVGQMSRTRDELSRVVDHVLGPRAAGLDVQLQTEVGRPCDEILRATERRPIDLIVMSSHGLTGMRRMFFGSTTERVPRGAQVPVFVTHPTDHGPSSAAEMEGRFHRILVPIDLDASAGRTVQAAFTLGERFRVPLLIAHVIEPTRLPFPRRADGPRLDSERRAQADAALQRLSAGLPATARAETLVAYGDPAEEIAKLARDRHADLIVIPTHANAAGGARMGSVAYRVICLAPSMVLALPGSVVAAGEHELDLGATAFAIV